MTSTQIQKIQRKPADNHKSAPADAPTVDKRIAQVWFADRNER